MSEVVQVVRKPYPISAMQYDGSNGSDIVEWMDWFVQDVGDNNRPDLHILCANGLYMYLSPGDWVAESPTEYIKITEKSYEKNYERYTE